MFKLPTTPAFDFKALADIQQKNVNAFVAANTRLAEGAQAVLKRQAELFQGAVKESMDVARETMAPANLGKLDKQIELFKSSTEKSVANAREIVELASKSSNEAVEILRQRASDSVSEWNSVMKPAA